MALIERISAMKQAGLSESQIISSLKEEGSSPRDIMEAISQSKIKAAVAEDVPSPGAGEMQASVMARADNSQQYMSVPNYAPASQEQVPQQQYAPQPQYAPEQYQQQYPQEQYAQDPNQQVGYDAAAYGQQYAQDPNQQPYYQQAIDLETVRDISRQQTDEALKKVREQIDILIKAKSDMGFQVQDIENRMKRIEAVIQDIQRAVLRKIGEYGEAISSISGEIKATQQSFAKVLNPILDKQRGIKSEYQEEREEREEPRQRQQPPQQQQNQKQNPSKQQNNQQSQSSRPRPSQGKGSATFEDYFR